MRSRPKREKVPKYDGHELEQAISLLGKQRFPSKKAYFKALCSAAGIIADASVRIAQEESAFHKGRVGSRKHRKTIEVHPSEDASADFRNIQNAIDRAWPGDRILLKSGIFRSGSVAWVWKDLAIEGEKGTVIEGSKERGKVIADPSANGGFIIIRGSSVQIRNIHFRNLYFAVASLEGKGRLDFRSNVCEDVYHSAYLSGPSLIAEGNRVVVSSLDNSSASCRFSFYDESHIFAFHCAGDALIENNHIEVRELIESQPFHSIGVFCSLGTAIVRNNLFKGFHAPLVLHECDCPIVMENRFIGLAQDPDHSPVAISLADCIDPLVSSNNIMCRLSRGCGIYAFGNSKGKILSNNIGIADSDSAIVIHSSNDFIVGMNNTGCPIGIFGNQSEDASGNLVFSNSIESESQLMLAYAKGNTVIGEHSENTELLDNALLGHYSCMSDELCKELEADANRRRHRISEHGRKPWPPVPERYGEQHE